MRSCISYPSLSVISPIAPPTGCTKIITFQLIDPIPYTVRNTCRRSHRILLLEHSSTSLLAYASTVVLQLSLLYRRHPPLRATGRRSQYTRGTSYPQCVTPCLCQNPPSSRLDAAGNRAAWKGTTKRQCSGQLETEMEDGLSMAMCNHAHVIFSLLVLGRIDDSSLHTAIKENSMEH